MDLILDFSNETQKGIGEEIIDPKKQYDQTYDDTTCVQFRSFRINRIDPMTYTELGETNVFKFAKMWDPYTGIRSETDDFYGPLYFHPINLLIYFYEYRLRGLWIETNDGYEGYYGDGLGAGEDFTIPCRGIYPERYLFRLPIIDCYLKKGHKLSLITMGPCLTDREMCEMDRILVRSWSNDYDYIRIYNKIGSLFKLKHYYDVAMAKKPLEMDLSGLELGDRDFALKQNDPNSYINRMAVEVLKKMI